MPSFFSTFSILLIIVILLSAANTSKLKFNAAVYQRIEGIREKKDAVQSKSVSPVSTGAVSPTNLRKNGPKKKPLFVLHIGPPKTGTTTLQCELGLKYADLLEENFYYLGTYYAPLCGLPMSHTIEGFSAVTRPVLLHCYAPHKREGCDLDKQWQKFADIILSHRTHNVIMSDEMFHHHFAQADVDRLAAVLTPHWDVRILYTYRHFYSSLPSMYRQLNDPYATEPGMPNAVEKTIWPANGGYKINSFRESNNFSIEGEMTRFFYWVVAFGSVHVFNMHNTNDDDYLPAFLCSMIPEAKSLCQKAEVDDASSDSHIDNSSARKYLRYDMLAVAAHEKGLLDHSNRSRESVRDAIQEYCESKKWTLADFPLDCLSVEEMQSFLKESLLEASMLRPYFANPRGDNSASSLEEEIQTGFEESRKKKKFCSVNADRALEAEHWKQFFLNMD